MSILLVEKNAQGTEAAVISRDRLYAFHGVSKGGLREGQILIGIVDRAIKGVGAVFVRLPEKEFGFLPFPAGAKSPASGSAVLVQVKRPPNQSKKAMLTTDISLGGSALVYLPLGSGVHVSSRIQNLLDKTALKARGAALLPEKGGLILRSAAAEASDAALSEELGFLLRRWDQISEGLSSAAAPALLWADDNPLDRLLQEEKGRLEYVLTNAPEEIPDTVSVPVKFSAHPFLLHNVRHKLEKSLRRTVQLKSGATLVIDPCEAMTVIDVNSAMASGGRSIAEMAERVNAEAAVEIARLLRLRGIGGMVVVDFIDMDSASAKERLLQTMREALLEDPAKTTVHDITALGLMEITRQRKQLPLTPLPDIPCPHCGGTGILFSQHKEDASNA